jgi:hypothetical protein
MLKGMALQHFDRTEPYEFQAGQKQAGGLPARDQSRKCSPRVSKGARQRDMRHPRAGTVVRVNRNAWQRSLHGTMTVQHLRRHNRGGPQNGPRSWENAEACEGDRQGMPAGRDPLDCGAHLVGRSVVRVDRERDMRRIAKSVPVAVDVRLGKRPPPILQERGTRWIEAEGDGERHEQHRTAGAQGRNWSRPQLVHVGRKATRSNSFRPACRVPVRGGSRPWRFLATLESRCHRRAPNAHCIATRGK